MAYIDDLTREDTGEKSPPGCFLCEHRDAPDGDVENLVLWRSPRTLVMLNRYPYTSGHALIAPTAHLADLSALPDDVMIELALRMRDVQRVLRAAVNAHGFNIGMNLGRCAGAGLPDHVHCHVVPRWNADTNFMPVLGDVRVMPQSLDSVRDAFLEHAARLGLPG